jgi:predicted ATPase/tetratricopeptide (TPR) repeat protein
MPANVLQLHPPGSPAPDRAATRWQLRLLGAVEARHVQGTAVQRFPSRAAVQLLARLALAPDRAHPREELVDLLWPDAPLDTGRNRLRQVLSVLKTALESAGGGPVILADRSTLRLSPGALACDATQFERLLRSGDWDQAEATYRGELLPGFYDEWVLEERTRLAALAERLHSRPRVPSARAVPIAAAAAPAPGQLPAFWTRLFGIDAPRSQLLALLPAQRLVTVVGAGGSGKTRLAVETARAAVLPADGGTPPAFERAVFVSLVDCSSTARAIDAMATALRVQGRDPLKAMAAALAGQRTLLLLDNCEQLAGQADAVLQQLLTDCATLHVLVTSRVRLNIDGEQVFELGGLPSRQGGAAVDLFVDRARAAAPAFTAGPAEAPALAELVRLLAGMPLAIELAASRMRSLSPGELLALLAEGKTAMLDLLSRDSAGDGLAQRHASMRHVVAWSWRQLPPPLVQVLQAAATFAAPARCETVAAVAGLPVAAARERLAQLRDHSLVLADRDARGVLRHVLLQPVREFAIDCTPPEQLLAMRTRLRSWLLDFARTQRERGHAAIEDVESELAQVYAAVLDAPADGPPAQVQALEMAVTLRRHWEIDTRAGLPRAVMHALHDTLPLVADAGLRSEASVLVAFSMVLGGFTAEARALAHAAAALADTPRRRAHALLRLGQVVMFSPGDQSTVDAPLAEAVQLAEQAGDLEAQALALRMQFLVAVNRDDDNLRAEALAVRVQSLWERLGHRRNAYSGLMDRASCWIRAGRLDEAATALAACERAALQEGYATGHIMSSWQLGRALLMLRQADDALAAFRRCLHHSWLHKRLAYAADALVLLPGGLAFSGQHDVAARLLGFAAAHWQGQFGSFYRDLERDVTRTRRWLRLQLGPLRLEALRLEGVGLTLSEAVAMALDGDGSATG